MAGRFGRVAAVAATVVVVGAVGALGAASLPVLLADERPARLDASPSAEPWTARESSIPSPSASPTPAERVATPEVPTDGGRAASPTATPTVRPTAAQATGPCARTGPGQRAVEAYLAAHKLFGPVTVDGRQSRGDCAAIRAFQQRYGILPSVGYAGPVTKRVATRLTGAWERDSGCRAGSGLTVCVDLTSQAMWVVRGGALVLGPTTVRTGRAGLATPAGTFSVHEKKRLTRSSYFDVDLPYWQRFHADMGFHATPSYLYEGDSPGSHGCINLLRRDAVRLFELTSRGTPVHIFGQKPV